MARRLDRRVQRTRKLLRESLMALILEEGYDAISIQDITDKANLGRATFYLHFKDKDELLLEVIDQFMADFLDQVPQISGVHWQLEDIKAITKLFEFAADHYDLYRIMIFGSGGITAARQLHRNIADEILAYINKEMDEGGVEPKVPPTFIANHFAGSLLATIYWWLDNDLPYSEEEMARMFQRVNQWDRNALMGLDQPQENHEEDQKGADQRKRAKDRRESKNKSSGTTPESTDEVKE